MGGLIGQWLGIHAGERLGRLVLCNTAAKIASDEVWNTRIDTVLKGGEQAMRDLRDASVARWFTAGFAEREPAQVEHIVAMLAATSPQGYAANCAAVRDADFREQLGLVQAPTLIVAGSHDARPLRTTPASCRRASPTRSWSSSPPRTCPTSKRATPSAAAWSISCCPPEEPPMDEKQRYEAGMQVRRAVLGDAHVERSLANLTPFNEEFQEMITRHAWGDIWTRPGLPRHTRSLVTIAMLIGMNRNEELKLHLRAAKNNGVSRDEIKEVIMQSAIYCGIPAANATFHLAESVWDELGVESQQASR